MRAQWERLSRGQKNKMLGDACMPIWKQEKSIITKMVEELIARNECPMYGCVDSPAYVNESLLWYESAFCDPLYFTSTPPLQLKQLEKKAQLPPPVPELFDGELVKGTGATVYIYLNSSLHAFPDLHTFTSYKGGSLDFDQVHNMADYVIRMIGIGDEMPHV